MTGDRAKRAAGRYYTTRNLFDTPHFRAWAESAGLPGATLIEPFAGRGDLIEMLRGLGLCRRARAYDIAPAAAWIERRDALADFPRGKAAVTNPPWLARNSATRRGLPFPQTPFDDLYKHCLDKCLGNAEYVAAIIPASFLSSRLFRERLLAVDVAAAPVFDDTENPVCLALFAPHGARDVMLYEGGREVGALSALEAHLPGGRGDARLRFNAPEGRLGLVAIDNTRGASIRFCDGGELEGYPIGSASRMITRIAGDFGQGDIPGLAAALNERLAEFRDNTRDIFLTPFKGLRKDGKYRRRLDYALARAFIAERQQARSAAAIATRRSAA